MCQRPLDGSVSSQAARQAIACGPWSCHLPTLSLHLVHCTIHVSSSEALFGGTASEHDLEKYFLCHTKDVQSLSIHHLVNFSADSMVRLRLLLAIQCECDSGVVARLIE